jgi:hypothetical protein
MQEAEFLVWIMALAPASSLLLPKEWVWGHPHTGVAVPVHACR